MISNMTNVTNQSKENTSDTNNVVDITIFLLGAAFALLYMVILNTLLIYMNRTMKLILNILLAHEFLTSVTLSMTLAMGRNPFTCDLMAVLNQSFFLMVFAHFAIISSVRFYLFKKSIENIHPDEKVIIGFTSLSYILVYVIVILTTILFDTPYEDFCIKDPSTSRDSTPFFILAIVTTFMLSIALYFDDKYIGLSKEFKHLSTRSHQENEFMIPVKASWASLYLTLVIIVMGAIITHRERKVSFTTANIFAFIFPNLLLMTILGLAYRESITFHPSKDRKDHRPPQSYIHLEQLIKDKRRSRRNSVTGDIIEDLLQDACETLIGHQLIEREPKVFGINDTSNGTTNFVQIDLEEGQKQKETKKAQKRPKSNNVDMKVEVHQELSRTRLKSARTQSNIEKDVIVTYQQHIAPGAVERNSIPKTEEQTKSGLSQTDLSQIQLHFEDENVKGTSDIIDSLSILDEQKLAHYHLSERKAEGKTFVDGEKISDHANLNKEHEMQEIQGSKKSNSNKVVIEAEVHQPKNGKDVSNATFEEHSASNVEEKTNKQKMIKIISTGLEKRCTSKKRM